jgi:hypothetical protein
MPNVPDAPRDSLLSRTSNFWIRATQALQWCNQLLNVADDLNTKGTRSQHTGAFVRLLYGVLVDIGPDHRTLILPVAERGRPIAERVEALDAKAQDIIKKMRRALSRTEAIALEYRRHCESHVFQNDYVTGRNGNPKTEKKVATLDDERPISIAEVDQAIDEYTRKYLHNEGAFAVELAKRLLPGIEALTQLLCDISNAAGPSGVGLVGAQQ